MNRPFLVVVLLCALAVCAEAKTGMFTVRVSDEEGRPVSDALVVAPFMVPLGSGGSVTVNDLVKQKTDTNGFCTIQGRGSGIPVGWRVEKDGYYVTHGEDVCFTNVVRRKLQPWGQHREATLRAIGRPVPMYAMNLRASNAIVIPVTNQSVGFDLMKCDWVAPHGKGDVTDFVFRMDQTRGGTSKDNYQVHDTQLTLSFPNAGDGILFVSNPQRHGSVFRLPRYAPEEGYSSNIVKRFSMATNAVGMAVSSRSHDREDESYVFRVRSHKEGDGRLVSHYGKITGKLECNYRGCVAFLYYLNPIPNDRNLEFDPARNLLKVGKSPKVYAP